MKDKFQMSSMGELTFFLGLQVKEKPDGIFISQDKYVAKILRKFRLTDGKLASTPIDTEKPLLKDHDGVNTPKSDEDRLELMELMIFLLPSDEKLGVKFWTSVDVKKVNDFTRLQALVNKKKVIITKAMIREALRLDDAEGVECLPNEEIFAELARMGYEKPSTKLTVYKAFALSQWKFLIHTILQCMSAKQTSWNEFSSSMASAIICLSSAQAVGEGDDDEVHVADVNAAGVATEGVVSAADVVVPTAIEEPSIPSPTPPTLPSQPPHDIPSTSQDKVAQALEIIKLKQQVKKLERKNKVKVFGLKRLKKVGTAQLVESSTNIVMDDASKQEGIIADIDADKDVTLEEVATKNAAIEESANDDEPEPDELKNVVEVVTTAKLMTKVVTAAAAPTITTPYSAARSRKGVVIRDPEETATPSTIIHSKPKSKDKGKGIMVQKPKPLKKQAQIEQDDAYARELEEELNKNINWDDVIEHVKEKGRKDNVLLRYQALKRKP
nr:ribonuclease H-like domain-containing protein [Tanacetum cinerariifolium]